MQSIAADGGTAAADGAGGARIVRLVGPEAVRGLPRTVSCAPFERGAETAAGAASLAGARHRKDSLFSAQLAD